MSPLNSGNKTAVLTEKAPAPIGPYSQAVLVDQILYVSGQLGVEPDSGLLKSESITQEFSQAIDNLMAVLQEVGAGSQDIVKMTIYMTDINQFDRLNQCYAGCFDAPYPARVVLEVSGLPKGANIEIDAIVRMPNVK